MSRLYSNLKFLRFREQLDALAQGGLAAPVHVRIKPINRCNHNCWYCAYRVGNLQLGEDIDLNDRICLLYTSPSPRDGLLSRMPSSA